MYVVDVYICILMYMYIHKYFYNIYAQASAQCRSQCRYTYIHKHLGYGVATINRLLKIIGLLCKEPYKRDCILPKRQYIYAQVGAQCRYMSHVYIYTHTYVHLRMCFDVYILGHAQRRLASMASSCACIASTFCAALSFILLFNPAHTTGSAMFIASPCWLIWISHSQDEAWMSHVTHMNESCHACASLRPVDVYKWVKSHIWRSHVAHTKESCRTSVCGMSHIQRSHVTHMNESCRTYERVILHIWVNHATHVNESCHTYESGTLSRTGKRALTS